MVFWNLFIFGRYISFRKKQTSCRYREQLGISRCKAFLKLLALSCPAFHFFTESPIRSRYSKEPSLSNSAHVSLKPSGLSGSVATRLHAYIIRISAFPHNEKVSSNDKTNKKSKTAYRIIFLYLWNILTGRSPKYYAPPCAIFLICFCSDRLRWPMKSYTRSERYGLNIPTPFSHSWDLRQWSEKA